MSAKKRKRRAARKEPPRRLSGWRGWAAKVALVLASPVLFLALLEGLLSLAGTGTPTAFLVPWRSGDLAASVTNRDFCLQFVPRALSREPERELLFPKQDGAVRIFVLGGSAAAGDPDAAYGFCRILEVLLNEGAAGPPVQVVNAAITAMNSHVARRVAIDCARHEADAFIVYMGNNEIIGPYGPHALPSLLYRSTTAVRGLMAARRSRVGQFVLSLLSGDGGPAPEWLGMEAFLDKHLPLADARLEACYRHFESNLRDIVDLASAAGARALVCTVPVNFRSCAPFGSQYGAGLATDALAAWQALFDEGRRLQRAGKPGEAAAKYEAAAALDDTHAALAFCMAACAEEAGQAERAAEHYRRARDLDTLRFRADGRINAIVRQAAETTDAQLLDLERVLEAHAEKGVLGDDLLLDHVHLNFRGNALAALAAAKALGEILPQLVREFPDTEQAVIERLRRRLLYDARAEVDVALLMYRRKTRPPFVGQLDHERDMALLRSGLIELRHSVRMQSLARSEDEHVAAVREAPDDPFVLRRLCEFLARHARADNAIVRYRERLAAAPWCAVTREGLAVALAALAEFDEAVQLLTEPANPFAMDPERALGYLGTTLIERGRAMESEELFRRGHELNDEDVGALTNLGAAASGRGQPEEAAALLTRALAINPRAVDAMVNLANTYVKRNHRADALEWFQKAVEANPYHVTAQCGLGLELTRHGQMTEGLEHMRRSVELNPAFVAGYRLLAMFYKKQGAHTLARDYAELASLFTGD